MRSTRTTAHRLALVLALLAGSSCSLEERLAPPRFFGAGAAEPRRGGTLKVALSDDVRTLDPAIAYDDYSVMAAHHLFDTLLDYAPADAEDPTALVPSLASSWDVSSDGRRYVFHLREARYADGAPIRAEDFVYAFERLFDPAVASPGAQFYIGVQGAKARLDGKRDAPLGIRAEDPRTLSIELDEPDASFPLLLALTFSSPVRAEHARRAGARLRDRPMASGPFMLESWNEGETLLLTRNPFYWNPELPYVDRIAIHLSLSRDVARLHFLRGDLDTLDRIAADDYVRFARMPAWEPYMFRSPAMGYFAEVMNTRRPPFDDRRVRQAMNYAIDRDDLVKLVNGLAVPAHGALPPGMLGYDPNRKPYPYDPSRARRLLAEAGYPHGFEVTYSTVGGEWGEKIAQSIQADLANVGIRMKIQILTFPVYATAVGRGELPFAFSGWNMDFPDPWNFLEVKFHSRMIADENSNNDSFYENPELDRLLDEARREQDRARRAELYRRAEEILFEDAANVWRFHAMHVEVRHPYVMNYRPHPVWLRDYRRTWLDLPRSERVAR